MTESGNAELPSPHQQQAIIQASEEAPRPDLVLEGQQELVIPNEIKNLRLTEQLTGGNIAYIDLEDFQKVRLVDRKTWQPLKRHGHYETLPLSEIQNRKFNAIIFVTPPRTKEENLDEHVKFLAKHIGRKTERKDGNDNPHHSGTLFIVEARGSGDERIGWRQDQMTQAGLVVDKIKGEKSVILTDDYIISMGRREKARLPIDLTKGKTSGNMYTDIPDATERLVEDQGAHADTSNVRQESKATYNPPRTINNLKRGGNTRFTMTNEDGKELFYEVDRDGIITSNNPDAFKNIYTTPKRENILDHKDGDKIENQNINCPECGQHPFDNYIKKPGKTHWLLVKKTICNGPHTDGYPKIFEDEFIKSLGRLPESFKKTS